MPFTAWIFMVLAVVVAAGVGFIAGRTSGAERRRIESLEQELAESRQAMQDYRAEVTRNLEQTAGLFIKLAGNYRELYKHLTDSAQKLTGTPATQLLPGALPDIKGDGPEGQAPRETPPPGQETHWPDAGLEPPRSAEAYYEEFTDRDEAREFDPSARPELTEEEDTTAAATPAVDERSRERG